MLGYVVAYVPEGIRYNALVHRETRGFWEQRQRQRQRHRHQQQRQEETKIQNEHAIARRYYSTHGSSNAVSSWGSRKFLPLLEFSISAFASCSFSRSLLRTGVAVD